MIRDICEKNSLYGPPCCEFNLFVKILSIKVAVGLSYSGWPGYQGNKTIAVRKIIEVTCWTMQFNIQELYIIIPHQVTDFLFLFYILIYSCKLIIDCIYVHFF